MRKKLKILIFNFFFLYCNNAFSNNETKSIMSLADAIKIFLNQNFDLKSGKEALKVKEYQVDSAKGTFFYPSMDINVDYSFGGWENSETEGDKKLKDSPMLSALAQPLDSMYHNIGTSLEVNKLLSASGRLKSAWNIASYQYYIEQLNLINKKNELIRALKLSFYGIFLKKELYNFFEEKYHLNEDLYNYQLNNFNNSKISEFEYLNVEIQKLESEKEVRYKKEELLYAINVLYTLLNIDLLEDISKNPYKFDGSLLDQEKDFYFLDSQELKELLFIKKDYLNIDSGSLNSDDFISKLRNLQFSIQDLIDFSYKNRIDFLVLFFHEKVLESKKTIARSYWLPEFYFFTKLEYNFINDKTFSKDFDKKFKYNLGLRMKIPFLQLIGLNNKAHSDTKAVSHEIKSLEAKIEYLKSNIKKEVIEIYYQYKSIGDNLLLQEKILDSSKKRFLIALDRYKNGSISYIEYKSYDLEYQKSKIDFYKYHFDYKKAFLDLLSKIGYL